MCADNALHILDFKEKVNSCEILLNLKKGKIVILRNFAPVVDFRKFILNHVREHSVRYEQEVIDFYDNKILPSREALGVLIKTINHIREHSILSSILSSFIKSLDCADEVLIDGGINRLVLPSIQKTLESLRKDQSLPVNTFERIGGADTSLVEIIMPKAAEPHRDFDRVHFHFQFNIWFCLHECNESEIIRIYPDLYHCTDGNYSKVLPPIIADSKFAKFKLNIGDCVMFHSEHLHTSPLAQGLINYRRHSYDFRVSTHSIDDNSHYRKNFINLKNFDYVNEKEMGSIKYFEKLTDKNIDLFHLFDLFENHEYCDDKYMLILNELCVEDKNLCSLIIDKMIKNTSSIFYIYKLIIKTQELGMIEYKKILLSRIKEMIGKVKFEPVVKTPHKNTSNQHDFNFYLDFISKYESNN